MSIHDTANLRASLCHPSRIGIDDLTNTQFVAYGENGNFHDSVFLYCEEILEKYKPADIAFMYTFPRNLLLMMANGAEINVMIV